MDIRKIKKLIELVNESDVTELEIHEGEASVRINRQGIAPTLVAAPTAIPAAPLAATPVETLTEEASSDTSDEPPAGHIIKSPIVGSFYRASSPTSAPFVEIGQQVNKGDTLCIVEAMKILNQIESDKAGKVIDILVENGQPIEYNQPLFVIG
jgi:acetyl-CoA carboxylase biotin carboxyl carrier protein